MMPSQVLIIDDNHDLAENVCELLAELDAYEVDCAFARSTKQALERCKAYGSQLDLALLDLRLPDGNGLLLLSELRKLCPYAEVVIMTADASVESAAAAVGEGAFAYVIKPVRGGDLIHTARRALDQARLVREREQLRHELEQSERRHREVVEAIPAFVLAMDAAGTITLWNRRLEEVTGFTREEMLGKSGLPLVGDGGDRRLPQKNGGHRLTRWQRAEVVDPNDAPYTYAMGIDVTGERVMLRRTLRAERLAAVGTLAAGLAHEVRNPLNSAILQLQVLRRRIERGQPTESTLPVVDIVHGEIKRLDRLVSDFLAFAQPAPLSLSPESLNHVVKSSVELVRPEAQALGVELAVDLDRNAGKVELDSERLRQVLLNLMRNGLEAMEGYDSPRLTLRTYAADEAGDVALEVEDTGPGFSDESPIFDAFYTTKASGTGLGLAIVHRLVTEHGGTISVASKPGCTRFTIRLPQYSPPEAEAGAETPETQ